jgi:hypothetical protein
MKLDGAKAVESGVAEGVEPPGDPEEPERLFQPSTSRAQTGGPNLTIAMSHELRETGARSLRLRCRPRQQLLLDLVQRREVLVPGLVAELASRLW